MKKNINHKLYTILLVTAMLIWTAGAAQALVTEYTDEAAYLAALASFGYSTFQEGFENDAVWGSVRSSVLVTNSAPSITSMGNTWTSNHPATNNITTGGGPALTGQWGIYDPNHGHATGTVEQCDVDTPPANCFFHDGFTGTREAGADTLYGAGGWINGTFGGKIIMIIDGNESNPIDFGDLGGVTAAHKFFGVIDTGGFTQFEFRETEGKVGDEKNVFGDDFTFSVNPSIFYVSALNGSDQSGDGSISDPWQTINYALSQIVAVAAPNTVRITDDTYTENVLVDKNGAVINLIGGCDESFLTCSTQTTIKGTLDIADATIVVENIVLEP
jgi:hypothetical protein